MTSFVDSLLLLSFLSYLIIGLFLVIKNRTSRSNILLACISFSSAMWTLGILLFRTIPYDYAALYCLNLLFIVSSGVIASSFLHFSIIFSLRDYRLTRIQSWLIHLPNVLILIAGMFPDVFIRDLIQQTWGRESILGWGYVYFGIYIVGYFLVGLLMLFLSYVKATGNYKNQLFYIIAATMFTGTIDIYFNLILILFGNYRYVWVGPYSFFFWVFILAYAITKTRLMDISVIISKSIAYGLTMVILGIGYLLFVIPYRLYISPAIDIGFISLSIAYGIFTGFAFERLRMFIQTSSDKVFLKGRYDFTDTLAGISEALSSIVSLKDFYDFLEKMRLDYIEASSLKVYIPGDQSQQIEHSLVEFLGRSKKIFHFSELPKDIAGSVNKAKIELLVPCFAKGKLAAILFVGKKLSEDPYREEEIDVFKVLAPQIATVIERVKPYEKVKEDYAAAQILADSAQKAAERAQNMAILGQIALQAGHEIKNPVAAINIHTELLTKHVGDAEHIGKYIELVKRNSKKIEDIVDKMKQFGTTKTEEKKPVDIAEIMNDRVLFLLEGYIKKKEIKVENNIGSHPKIMGDESSLEKAFVNIILNSIEAMDAGGMLSVSSHTEDKKIVIKIKDTGCGISKDDLDKIFLPMFTTKHEGTGLGLSIAYKTIVTDHGGSIDVKCEEGKGTEFTVTLPVS